EEPWPAAISILCLYCHRSISCRWRPASADGCPKNETIPFRSFTKGLAGHKSRWAGGPPYRGSRPHGCGRENVMAGFPTGARLQRRSPRRTGRPPRKLAGEVDARILDAARRVFLERGLAGASIDEIAELACAGKPTIYARFPGKEALFIAVVMRNVAPNIARFESYVPTGTSIEERLASLGAAILHWLLAGNTVGLMRLSIAESRRFPELASSVHHMARGRGLEAVGRLLAEAAQSAE